MAMLAAVICNVSGKSMKKSVDASVFLPNYIGTQKEITDPLQRDQYAAFRDKLNAAQGK